MPVKPHTSKVVTRSTQPNGRPTIMEPGRGGGNNPSNKVKPNDPAIHAADPTRPVDPDWPATSHPPVTFANDWHTPLPPGFVWLDQWCHKTPAEQIAAHGIEYLPLCGSPEGVLLSPRPRCCDPRNFGPCEYRFLLHPHHIFKKLKLGETIPADVLKQIIVGTIKTKNLDDRGLFPYNGQPDPTDPAKYWWGEQAQFNCTACADLIPHAGTEQIPGGGLGLGDEWWNYGVWCRPKHAWRLPEGEERQSWISGSDIYDPENWVIVGWQGPEPKKWLAGNGLDDCLKCLASIPGNQITGSIANCGEAAFDHGDLRWKSPAEEIARDNLFILGVDPAVGYSGDQDRFYYIRITKVTYTFGDKVYIPVAGQPPPPNPDLPFFYPLVKCVVEWEWARNSDLTATHPCVDEGEDGDGFGTTEIMPLTAWAAGEPITFVEPVPDNMYYETDLELGVKIRFFGTTAQWVGKHNWRPPGLPIGGNGAVRVYEPEDPIISGPTWVRAFRWGMWTEDGQAQLPDPTEVDEEGDPIIIGSDELLTPIGYLKGNDARCGSGMRHREPHRPKCGCPIDLFTAWISTDTETQPEGENRLCGLCHLLCCRDLSRSLEEPEGNQLDEGWESVIELNNTIEKVACVCLDAISSRTDCGCQEATPPEDRDTDPPIHSDDFPPDRPHSFECSGAQNVIMLTWGQGADWNLDPGAGRDDIGDPNLNGDYLQLQYDAFNILDPTNPETYDILLDPNETTYQIGGSGHPGWLVDRYGVRYPYDNTRYWFRLRACDYHGNCSDWVYCDTITWPAPGP